MGSSFAGEIWPQKHHKTYISFRVIVISLKVIIIADRMKLEEKVVGLLSRSGEKMNINQIALALDEHYSYVHRKVKEMEGKDVLRMERAGNTLLIEPNFENDQTRALLHLYEVKKRDKFYEKNKKLALLLKEFINQIKDKVDFVVLFGSYAKGEGTEESDIDLYLVVKKETDLSQIKKEIKDRYGKEISIVQSTKREWKKDKEKPIGKEILMNGIVLIGFENYLEEVYG